jgi:hypothetical protein
VAQRLRHHLAVPCRIFPNWSLAADLGDHECGRSSVLVIGASHSLQIESFHLLVRILLYVDAVVAIVRPLASARIMMWHQLHREEAKAQKTKVSDFLSQV